MTEETGLDKLIKEIRAKVYDDVYDAISMYGSYQLDPIRLAEQISDIAGLLVRGRLEERGVK